MPRRTRKKYTQGKKKRVVVSLDPETLEQIDRVVESGVLGNTRSEVVRNIIKHYATKPEAFSERVGEILEEVHDYAAKG